MLFLLDNRYGCLCAAWLCCGCCWTACSHPVGIRGYVLSCMWGCCSTCTSAG